MSASEHPAAPISLFYSYSHKDDALREKLETHLSLLKDQGVIREWYDRRIEPGTEWDGVISNNLNAAEIILLLVSADFLASRYCHDVEIAEAMKRHGEGTARVIPVILRPVDWHTASFGKLQALPKDGKPVTSWKNRDEAFTDIARGIREVATSPAAGASNPPIPARPSTSVPTLPAAKPTRAVDQPPVFSSDSTGPAPVSRPKTMPPGPTHQVGRGQIVAGWWKSIFALSTLLVAVIVAVVLTWFRWENHLPPQTNPPIPKPIVLAQAVVDESRRSQKIETATDKLAKLFKKINYNGPAPKTESFEAYRKRVESKFPFRGQVIVQPLRVANEDLTEKQSDICKRISDLLEEFFEIKREEIKVADSLNLLVLEEPTTAAKPVAPEKREEKTPIQVEKIFERLHKKYNDDSPRAVLGITNRDMVSGDQICIRAISDNDRWAVFSFARLLKADRGREYKGCQIQAFQLAAYCFVRTLKVKPCSTFICGMNEDFNVVGMKEGTLPYDFCPECCKKIWWACEIEEPAERYGRLVRFADRYGLMKEARDFWSQAESVVSDTGANGPSSK